MRPAIWLVLLPAAGALAGCTVQDRDYTGPTIAMQLTDNGFENVEDTDPMPAFMLGTDSSYSIDVEILTHAGTMSTKGSDRSSQVSGVTAKLTLAGQDVPSPGFTSDHSALDPTFTTRMPIVIPASAMGGTFGVHATAVDSDGLESNVIDLTVALQ